MSATEAEMVVRNRAELRTVYPEPRPRAAQKVLDHLDVHCRNFIEMSPFCVLSTTGSNGRADASPRGDPPGFVKVLDAHTLLIPDRPGNNQIDSLQNIIDHPVVGLLFFVPGMNETLRVCGSAEIVSDEELLAPLSVGGRAPLSGVKITIKDAFLHCGRALIRSRLWDPEVQIDRSSYPTYGQVLADQIAGADAGAIDADEDEANRKQLY
ncbi:MAG: pyridoxamine 5'-phosphate oxidase family protein [bacterium]|nr:pyridoxamine 5'-phosphate oxidase family protein [bacterium]